VRYGASALSGVLLALCFPLYNLHPLVWFAVLPLLLATLSEPRLGRAYLLGAITGSVFQAGSVYWFAGVMQNYGRMGSAAALAVMVLFLLVDSSYWGAFALIEAWLARRSAGLALLAAPFLWAAMELAETYGYFGGFPWNLTGYAVEANGLRQIATATGVYGLSFLALATAALAGWALIEHRRARKQIALATLALWAGGLIFANHALEPPPPASGRTLAILVQPNVPLNESADTWAPWRNPGPLRHLIDITLAKFSESPPGEGPPLIVWSENSAPFYFDRDPVFRSAIEGLARASGADVIVGTVNFVGGDLSRPLNSAMVLNPSGHVTLHYDKIHLVPFGEYVPAWLDHLVGKITSQAGNFVPGSNYTSAQADQGAIGVFICYEDIFPQLVRKLTPRGPSVLANISDDAWYGDSSAASQSLEMARLRAIEERRYLLRATDDGITAVIDPYGRVLETLPRHQQAALAGRFDYEGEETFYHTHGDVFAWLCVTLAAALAAIGMKEAVGSKQSAAGSGQSAGRATVDC
jgi:apolipoprotein N-acyltransferase